MTKNTKKNPAAVALGRLGGKATLKKHGKKLFKEMNIKSKLPNKK